MTEHSNYHAWVRAKARRDERAIDEQDLLAWITEIHTAHPAYGAQRCPCRKPHPCRSGGMFVFVQDAAEAVASSDVEVRDVAKIGDRSA